MELKEVFTHLVACVLSMSILCVTAKRNHAVYCGACIGLVEEMNWGIANTDSREKIQVGSFRVDSKGNQALSEIPLKYSELHLTDLLEDACVQVGQYAESRKEDSDKVNFIRTNSRDGQAISMRHIQISRDTQTLLKFACDTVVEEHEEEIIALYKKQETDMHTKLCIDLAGMCIAENITDFNGAMEEMVKEAVREEAELKAEEEKRQAEELARAEEREEWGDEDADKSAEDDNIDEEGESESDKKDKNKQENKGEVESEEETKDEL